MQRPRFKLPEALVMEILSKLPVKSLTRFNCVCKYWCSSFQTPHFISKHHHYNLENSNLNLLLSRRDGNTFQLYFSQLSNEKDQNYIVKQNIHLPFFKNDVPSVYGACHGLLCLLDPSKDNAAIWNPSTENDVYFDHAAFGFDSKTDDYKVIRFVSLTFVNSEEEHPHPHSMYQVELYSLRSNSWKEIPSPEYIPTYTTLGNIYVDGICYWKTETGAYLDFRGLILSFDMGNEKFSILPIPEFVGSFPEYYVDLLVFNGSLGAIVYPSERIDTSFDLWVTSEGVWTKQFNIKSISGVVRPLGFGKNGDLFVRDTNNEVLLFDASTQELRKLEINTYLDHIWAVITLHAYFESLVHINGVQEVEKHVIRQPTRDASNEY
ncbi:F-box/kelch-repeat protein At3g23880-like [Gossypium arboreum]|uniref:F-box/kelch-repeat protein At3g23880-like n=1 Tax=Gossypium arboreum TaxID=29729 RepID=UPI0022F19443|nr:F-box/kelch-repeat protein At3g23880-like [Gossypium arboreum]